MDEVETRDTLGVGHLLLKGTQLATSHQFLDLLFVLELEFLIMLLVPPYPR
jgi:hypothetical protein